VDRKIKGFTVIELLIVIAIIAIISAVIYKPISIKIQQHKVNSEIKKVYGLLQEARMLAFSRKKSLQFSFSGSNACIYDLSTSPPTQIKCISLELPISFSSGGNLKITDRGTFSNQGTIRYTGSTTTPTVNCIVVSTTRVKMGVWDGSNCKVK